MCGIVGRLNFDGTPVDDVALTRARNTLSNRGPDGAGTWTDGAVGLAHRRLSVLDLSERGAQPMHDADGALVITFNGEIYNFRELRKELAAAGHRFATQTDTEVILAAYREWGVECLHHFNGMFAFALWDGHRRRLWLTRDRLGVKPLYYAQDGRRIVFGSTLKAVTAFADVSREISAEATDLFFQMSYIPAPHSIYRAVHKLEPGTWLECGADGSTRVERYWSLSPRGTASVDSTASAADALEELLDSSVRYRLISDVPVGAFLSGGIDSSTVVALMCRNSDTVRTFTIGFDETEFDESAHAREVARRLGTRHEELVLRPGDLLAIAKEVPEHYDEPFADASAIPSLAIARLARTEVTVALSGDGGDELFAGYPWYGRLAGLDPWRRRSAFAAPLLRATPALPLPHSAAMGLAALAQPSTSDLYAYMRGPLKRRPYRGVVSGFAAGAADWFDHRLGSEVPAGTLIERYMDLDLRSYLVDDILVKVDRATMAHGLEARNPLLDYRVVEFARALPGCLRTGSLGQKQVLRQVLERMLPADLFARPKQGFSVPIRQWFRGPLEPALRQAVLGGWLTSTGFFRPGSVAKLVDEHSSGRRNHENFLWAIYAFEQWYVRYGS
ncbi:asparagine synthase (glutamine-hydrolyzing) [Mycobacterium sp. URHB0044]|uniref:asparagine synthase (glutamine-hydrolyzing) n=1 Tax=Mycobacterium sp. URHB0044 TaxID=1380386 RepID=UPI00048D0F33|nr:asparagine synthase (glutamine-hydrolyzing) [Mycobacterium sp. URHB0044]